MFRKAYKRVPLPGFNGKNNTIWYFIAHGTEPVCRHISRGS